MSLKGIDMKKLFSSAKVGALVALASAGALALPAQAAAVNVGDVVTDISAQLGPIGLIGSAVLLVVVGVAAFRWIRSALR